MDFEAICRTCLADKSLSPIFKILEHHDRFSIAMQYTTGLKVELNDGLPQKICMKCMAHINDSLKFRAQCKDAETKLLQIISNNVDNAKFTNTVFFEHDKDYEEVALNEEKPLEALKKNENCIKVESSSFYLYLEDEKQSGLNYSSENEKQSSNGLEYEKQLSLNYSSEDEKYSSLRNHVSEYEKQLSFNDCLKNEKKIILKYSSQDKKQSSLNYNSEDEKPLKYLINNQREQVANNSENSLFTDGLNSKNLLTAKDLDIVTPNVITENKLIIKNLKNKSNDNLEFDTEPEYNTNNETLSNKIKLKAIEYIKTANKRVTCKVCKKSLSVRSVSYHMSKMHPGADERKVNCEFCEAYVMKSKLGQHLRKMHGQDCSVCKYCKQEFRNKEALLKHVISCADKKRKRNQYHASKEMSECDICHKKMQKASLKMHQRIKHAGLGPVCDHCGRKFGNKFRLNEHLRSKHEYDKFKCAQCEFQSASATSMKNHERRHRGEKPYVCERCGATFHAAYLLAQHKHSHRTDKLVKCDLCPASFKVRNSLHMHKAACHSTRKYKCTMCARAYSCRHYAVKHLRSVHHYTGPVPRLDQRPTS